MPSTPDAIVIGGGPSGVSTAITLRQQGLRPLIVEKEPFPRYHIGESLLPKGMDMLGELGLLERVEREGFIVKYGARFYSKAEEIDATLQFLDAPEGQRRPTAYQVEREVFDQILLDGARDQGVEVWSPAKVVDFKITKDEAVVEVDREFGRTTVRAPMVFDASGQSSFSSRLHGTRRRIPTLLTHAFFGYFKGWERLPGPEGGNILVTFRPGGWIWCIPLRDEITSIGVVLLEETDRPEGLEEILLHSMSKYLPNAEADYRPKLVSHVRAYSAINFACTQYVDDRLMLVGDAACFLDPVFSTGVFLGLWAGRLAAKTASAAMAKGDLSREALRPYEVQARQIHRVTLELVQMFYRGSFIRFLGRANEKSSAVRDIVGLLAGDMLNPNNNLSRALMERTKDDLPVAAP